MKFLTKLLNTYGWENLYDFGMSLAPSFKYHLGFVSLAVSGILAIIQMALGISSLSILAFMALAFLEVVTGIYSSVIIKKQKLQSGKMSRFIIKLALMLICLFILGQFAKDYQGRLLGNFFTWMRDGVFTFTVIEYIVSVLENVAIISGKPNSRLLNSIKAKLDTYLDSDVNTPNT